MIKKIAKVLLGITFAASVAANYLTVKLFKCATSHEVVRDVICKGLRETIGDTVETLLNGAPRKKYSSPNHYQPYSSYSHQSYYQKWNKLVFATKDDADAVLLEMRKTIQAYGEASIGDLYSIVDYPHGDWLDMNMGWKDLRYAFSFKLNDGWRLSLPYPTHLAMVNEGADSKEETK